MSASDGACYTSHSQISATHRHNAEFFFLFSHINIIFIIACLFVKTIIIIIVITAIIGCLFYEKTGFTCIWYLYLYMYASTIYKYTHNRVHAQREFKKKPIFFAYFLHGFSFIILNNLVLWNPVKPPDRAKEIQTFSQYVVFLLFQKEHPNEQT